MQTFTRQDVKAHNTEKDCWIIINKDVLDVSKFLDDHPGGGNIILTYGGEDCTHEFRDIGHSPDAVKSLKKYRIGEVKN